MAEKGTSSKKASSTLAEVSEAVHAVDEAAARKALPLRDSWPVRILDQVADLADQPPLRILCGSVIAIGLVGRDRRLARTGLRMLAAHSLATGAKNMIKRRIDRTRPNAISKPGKDHRLSPGRNPTKEETSFPSGHSAGVAAVARAFARDYPQHGGAAATAAGVLALAQIPRCAHYPSDVGAGLAIGIAAEALVQMVMGAVEDIAPQVGGEPMAPIAPIG